MMKINHCTNEQGFALITAIMMLFAATVLGLMAINSSEIEVILSGAQQRYENNFNTVEGGTSVEAATVGTASTVTRTIDGTPYTRSYAVVSPTIPNQVLSPTNSAAKIFDPGNDMDLPATAYTLTENTPREQWPTDNLMESSATGDNQYDYQYRTIYREMTSPPKGYDMGKYTGYVFEISAHRNTRIDMGANKVGPKQE